MLRELYKQYIRISRGLSDRTVGHYITGINTINAILAKYHYPITDVFSVSTFEELNSIKTFLENNDEFVTKDSVGHNMYSVAFNHFYRFACVEEQFFKKDIQQMDIPVQVPKTIQTRTSSWKRNQIIKCQVIIGADFTCENNGEHQTFISKATGKPYMEGHHLIPIRYQTEFKTSIDVYANVVCLCPNCHRLLHFGTDRDKTYAAEKLFDSRSERLIKSGIDLSKHDFVSLIV